MNDKFEVNEEAIKRLKEGVTDNHEHYCGWTPRMAHIEFNKKLKDDSPELPDLNRSGFELTLIQRKKEGKLFPKTYDIKVPVEFCPFCGQKLEAKPHLESCECILCSPTKMEKPKKAFDDEGN